MIMIIGFINKFKREKRFKYLKQFFTKGINSILQPSFNMRLDNPIPGNKYLKIGSDCIIGGNFIFESNKGFVEIGDNTFIGSSTFISISKIYIGNNVHIAWGCTFYDHDSHSLDYIERRKDMNDQLSCLRLSKQITETKNWNSVKSSQIKIENDAWIGMNCIILKGVTIGKGAVVGAGSVVTKDVPEWTVVAGNPAKIVKEIDNIENGGGKLLIVRYLVA